MSPGMERTIRAAKYIDYLVALQRSDSRSLMELSDLAISKEVAKSYGISKSIMQDEVMSCIYVLEHGKR